MLRVQACGLSDVGRARRHNEDYFELDPERCLYIVADGMGGHSHGEVASRLAVKAIREYIGKAASGEESGRRSNVLRTAIQLAHEQVLRAIRQDGTLQGMGTTVVCFFLTGHTAAVAHVGDSRAYRYRQGRLELLTQDHTWVHEQVVAGYLSREQARAHPLKNVVTRALGGEVDVVVDIREMEACPGDLFLLCSDGLTTMLSDEEIRAQVAAATSLDDLCRNLVREANARGGLDNITVLALAIEEANGEDDSPGDF